MPSLPVAPVACHSLVYHKPYSQIIQDGLRAAQRWCGWKSPAHGLPAGIGQAGQTNLRKWTGQSLPKLSWPIHVREMPVQLAVSMLEDLAS